MHGLDTSLSPLKRPDAHTRYDRAWSEIRSMGFLGFCSWSESKCIAIFGVCLWLPEIPHSQLEQSFQVKKRDSTMALGKHHPTTNQRCSSFLCGQAKMLWWAAEVLQTFFLSCLLTSQADHKFFTICFLAGFMKLDLMVM